MIKTKQKRAQWQPNLGFIWAAVGSAVGLGSIWRFPYVVGQNGGATFVIIYLICLLIVGFPTLIAEVTIGRKAQSSPLQAFYGLGKHYVWKYIGTVTVFTGFLVSAFYAVVAGWALGYFFQALFGKLTHLNTSQEAIAHFNHFIQSPYWALAALLGFVLLAMWVLRTGVSKGIEAGNKIMMPLLSFVLILLVIKGLTMPNSYKGIVFYYNQTGSR